MKKIIVVDLDGCFCSVNTFRYWLLFSFLYLFFSLRWISLLKYIQCIYLRVFGSSDRVQMKECVLKITEKLPKNAIRWFSGFLQLFVNRDVLLEMHKYNDMDIVLCTAAPVIYVDAFAGKYNFAKVFATPSVYKAGWEENIGGVKLENLKIFYGEDVVLSCVITDHHDDLPMLLKANRRVLVRPSDATLAKVADAFEFDTL